MKEADERILSIQMENKLLLFLFFKVNYYKVIINITMKGLLYSIYITS